MSSTRGAWRREKGLVYVAAAEDPQEESEKGGEGGILPRTAGGGAERAG